MNARCHIDKHQEQVEDYPNLSDSDFVAFIVVAADSEASDSGEANDSEDEILRS